MLEPYIGTIKSALVTLLVLALFAFGYHVGGEHVQAQWNIAKLAQAQVAAKAETENRTKEQAWAKQLEDAQNEATQLKTAALADADAARRSNDSLRDQLSTAKRAVSTASADAVRQYAATLSDVFEDCAGKYRSLAEAATGHATDIRTLTNGWPK